MIWNLERLRIINSIFTTLLQDIFVFVGCAKLFALCSLRLYNRVFGDAVRWGVPKILSHGSWCCEFNMHLRKNATPLRHKYWECALVVFGALPYFQMSVTNMIAGWMGNSQNSAFSLLETNHGLVNLEKLSRRVSGLQYSAIDFYLAASSGLDLRGLETSPKITAITSLQDHANHDRIMFALEYCPWPTL